jgi:hypothetical protein
MTNLRNFFMVVLAIMGLSIAAPAMAQSTTTTPTNSQCGTVCPSGILVTGTAVFGGQVLGGFGAIVDGQLANTNGVTGTVAGTKEGGGDADVTIIYNGPGCAISCGSATVDANINAFERGTMKVTVGGSGAGGMYGVANTGTLTAGAGLSIGYYPGTPSPTVSTPSTTPHTTN